MLAETSLALIDATIARLLPMNIALEFGVLAIAADATTVTLAVSEPLTAGAMARIERLSGRKVSVRQFPAHLIAPEIARCYGTAKAAEHDDAEEPGAVAKVNALFQRAMLERASDVHISPVGSEIVVRMRIDGVLRTVETLERGIAPRVISRVKLIAGMDIAERRLPQDGRVSFTFQSRPIDVRVASLPTESGERIAMRILDAQTAAMNIDDLGLSRAALIEFRRLLRGAGGLILTCGPTGSGKTTTLYAALHEVDRVQRHICTVEDPVERQIPGVSQVSINHRSGLDFAVTLRALLRQDPDVIMIGEIRDEETAQTAVNAALTGQLVLATVHSPNAGGVLERLRELGVTSTTLAAVLSGIIAQRLVRKLCRNCRRAENNAFVSVGCETCGNTGYRGRMALFDFVSIDDRMRSAIAEARALPQSDARAENIRVQIAHAVETGATSLDEIDRIAPMWCAR